MRSAASSARAACGSATRSRRPASSASSTAAITPRSGCSPAPTSGTSTRATWWMCDEGRYGYGFVDDASRLMTPLLRGRDGGRDVVWADALAAVADALGRAQGRETAVIASPKMANEDLFALRTLALARDIRDVGFRVPPRLVGDEDDFLIRADKNPNTRGAELMGLDGDVRSILDSARARRVRCLGVFDHDLFQSAWP